MADLLGDRPSVAGGVCTPPALPFRLDRHLLGRSRNKPLSKPALAGVSRQAVLTLRGLGTLPCPSRLTGSVPASPFYRMCQANPWRRWRGLNPRPRDSGRTQCRHISRSPSELQQQNQAGFSPTSKVTASAFRPRRPHRFCSPIVSAPAVHRHCGRYLASSYSCAPLTGHGLVTPAILCRVFHSVATVPGYASAGLRHTTSWSLSAFVDRARCAVHPVSAVPLHW